jgi:AAA15 family ATPase/GTPase
MSEHFIREIEIKNFKCFEDFKAEGFGRVNLIGGKNNVGKTTLMETSYICLQQSEYALMQTFIIRDKKNYIYNDKFKPNSFKKNYRELLKQEFNIVINENIKSNYNQKIHSTKELFKTDIEEIFDNLAFNIQFLDSGVTDKELEKSYGILQEQNRENILNEYIQKLDSSIKKFKFIQSLPKLQVGDKYIHLSNFGDGLKSYISIICALHACKDGQLFIDEIENGIHYSLLDKLWEIILTISKQQNVQVFATTHSKECIESYARVAKKLEDEEIAFIELGRNKNNELDSIIMNSEMFQRFIKLGNEVRGW